MKCYVLIISRHFPAKHPRAGQRTNFENSFISLGSKCKIHTIRHNYTLWEKRFKEIEAGKAYLSIRYWSGKPRQSKQVTLLNLSVNDKIGIQKLTNPDNFAFATIDDKLVNWDVVSKNDGLEFKDFCDWFKEPGPDPMAVIHFTAFRY